MFGTSSKILITIPVLTEIKGLIAIRALAAIKHPSWSKTINLRFYNASKFEHSPCAPSLVMEKYFEFPAVDFMGPRTAEEFNFAFENVL